MRDIYYRRNKKRYYGGKRKILTEILFSSVFVGIKQKTEPSPIVIGNKRRYGKADTEGGKQRQGHILCKILCPENPAPARLIKHSLVGAAK